MTANVVIGFIFVFAPYCLGVSPVNARIQAIELELSQLRLKLGVLRQEADDINAQFETDLRHSVAFSILGGVATGLTVDYTTNRRRLKARRFGCKEVFTGFSSESFGKALLGAFFITPVGSVAGIFLNLPDYPSYIVMIDQELWDVKKQIRALESELENLTGTPDNDLD